MTMRSNNATPLPTHALVPAVLAALTVVGFTAGCVSRESTRSTEIKVESRSQPGTIAGKPIGGEQKSGTVPGGEQGDEYTVAVRPGAGKVGEEGTVTVELVPKATWHLNLEYPTKLTVVAPAGVTVVADELGRDDAVQFGEERFEFAVAYTPEDAGDKAFTGTFKFAVCQEEVCSSRTETLAFNVPVE